MRLLTRQTHVEELDNARCQTRNDEAASLELRGEEAVEKVLIAIGRGMKAGGGWDGAEMETVEGGLYVSRYISPEFCRSSCPSTLVSSSTASS